MKHLKAKTRPSKQTVVTVKSIEIYSIYV